MDKPKAYFFATALAGMLFLGTAQVSFGQNLIQNGTFTSFSLTSTTSTADGGAGLNIAGGYQGGDTLTGWANTGYSFVFTTSNSLDGGTVQGSGGPFALWSSRVTDGGMTGLTRVTQPPGGGNVVAIDGAYEVGTFSQTLTGLTVGDTYQLSFEWAAAQQAGYNTTTSDTVMVNFGGTFTTTNMDDGGYFTGGTTVSTTNVKLAARDFSGWMSETMNFTYTTNDANEVLSFLDYGGPTGDPPFLLLADVQMIEVPEPIATSFWTLFFGILVLFGNRAFRWYRYRKRSSTDTSCVQVVEVPECIVTSPWTLFFGMLSQFGDRAWRRYRYRKRSSTDTS